ncbi:hypothetical protein JRQ81_006674 [Phrynocephalus forsythii]|uniref:Uncharacterized protein n=1 Tax=Phrynocephalus forsythii TaxID=171643 RepID=A0A9Q1ATR1_9SAUR|nr:hypothetical protein JRQ81_006674 [Phrynocephalus forsythii]
MERRAEGASQADATSPPGVMAALQAAKRALRAELKRRLRALSEGEKRRQSGRLAWQVGAADRARRDREGLQERWFPEAHAFQRTSTRIPAAGHPPPPESPTSAPKRRI